MKFLLLLCVCALYDASALAAPQVTEIRLEDAPGFIAPPISRNEFMFRADGNFYWTEGTLEKPVRHSYLIGTQAFQKLVAALNSHHFFEMKPRYDRLKPKDPVISDGPTVVVSAMRNGLRKTVVDYSGFGPHELWEVEMILRGFAFQSIGMKRTPITSTSVPHRPTPRATTAPVIRGTRKTPD